MAHASHVSRSLKAAGFDMAEFGRPDWKSFDLMQGRDGAVYVWPVDLQRAGRDRIATHLRDQGYDVDDQHDGVILSVTGRPRRIR